MKHAFVCYERTRLLNEHNIATLALSASSASVVDLIQKTGTTLKAEYGRLKNVTDQACITAEQARANLEKHIAEHGAPGMMIQAAERCANPGASLNRLFDARSHGQSRTSVKFEGKSSRELLGMGAFLVLIECPDRLHQGFA